MASNAGGLKIVAPTAGPVTVTLTAPSGVVPVVYSDPALTTTVALPVTVTGTQTIYLSSAGAYTLSVLFDGRQVADPAQGTAQTLSFDSGQLAVLDYSGVRSTALSFGPGSDIRPGNRTVFLGDSTTVGSDDPTNQARGDSWPVYASIGSGQRIRYVRNAGVFGNTSAQMLARFDTDVTPYNPNCVTIMAGTNDTGNNTPLATFQSNIQAIVAKTKAIGAVPVLCTMLPNSTGAPTNRRQLVIQFNAWLRRYAASQGILLLDFYSVVVDPANGNFLSAYNNDGTHPNGAGYAAMGAYAVTNLAPILPTTTPVICQDDVDENNFHYKGCMTAASGSALPTGYIDEAGTPTGSVISFTTDAAVPGQLLTITSTASSGARQIGAAFPMSTTTMPATSAGATSFSLATTPTARGMLFIGSGNTYEIAKVASVSGSGPYTVTVTRALVYAHSAGEQVICNGVAGDTFLVSGLVTTDGGVTVSAGCVQTPAQTGYKAMAVLSRAITRGLYHLEFTTPAGTTQVLPYVQVNAGTGVTSFGQFGFYNLTRMGA